MCRAITSARDYHSAFACADADVETADRSAVSTLTFTSLDSFKTFMSDDEADKLSRTSALGETACVVVSDLRPLRITFSDSTAEMRVHCSVKIENVHGVAQA
jgi:predicted transcriptional regulator